MQQFVVLCSFHDFKNPLWFPGPTFLPFFDRRTYFRDFVDIVPLFRIQESCRQNRVAFLNCCRWKCLNIIITPIRLWTAAWLHCQTIEKIINIFRGDGTHDDIAKYRKNVIIQIRSITVIGVWRQAFFSYMVWKPLLDELAKGFGVVVSSVCRQRLAMIGR